MNLTKVKLKKAISQREKKQGKITKIVAKPHQQRSIARSQLQAISELASGVNKLADVNAK